MMHNLKQSLPKRQHPMSIFINGIKSIWYSVFPVLFIFILGDDKALWSIITGVSLIGAIIIFSFILNFFTWRNYTYHFSEHHIHLVEGRFISKNRNIALRRIQSFQQNTSFIHKILKQTSLTLVLGTDNIVLSMIPTKEAERITTILQSFNQEDSEDNSPVYESNESGDVKQATEHYLISRRELVLIAFSSLYFLAIIPIGLTIYNWLEDVFDVDKYAQNLYTLITQSWIFIVLIGLLLLFLSVLAGFFITYLRYGKYRVASDDKKIYISKGVLNTTNYTISRDRINGLIIQKRPIRRLFGIVNVKLVSLGDALSELESETDVLFPFISMSRLEELLADILPEYPIEQAKHMIGLPKRALKYNLLVAFLTLTPFIGVGLYFFLSFWYIILGVILLTVGLVLLQTKQTKHMVNERFVQFQTGTLTLETFVTRRLKIDQVEYRSSWLQRKFSLSSLAIITREKPFKTSIMHAIPTSIARTYYTWYAEGIIAEKQNR